jgi:hypothetical protein
MKSRPVLSGASQLAVHWLIVTHSLIELVGHVTDLGLARVLPSATDIATGAQGRVYPRTSM